MARWVRRWISSWSVERQSPAGGTGMGLGFFLADFFLADFLAGISEILISCFGKELRSLL